MHIQDVEVYPLKRLVDGDQDDACATKERGASNNRSLWATLLLSLIPALVVLIVVLSVSDAGFETSQRAAFEQIAGGLMLCTYMYALFNNESFVRVRSVGTKTSIPCEPLWSRAFFVMAGFAAGVCLLDYLEDDSVDWPVPHARSPTPLAEYSSHVQTARDMAPYAIGFFTDGITIALVISTSNKPDRWLQIRGQGALPSTGEIMLALLFSADNVVTGLGLSSIVATQDPGRAAWAFIFFGCVLGGGLVGFFLREGLDFLKRTVLKTWKDTHPADLIELFIKSFFAASILEGALDFLTKGLSPAALVGILIGWMLLFASDRLDAVKYDLLCCGEEIPLYSN